MNLMVTVLTAWGYELSLLELIAFITAVIGVGLGVLGPRTFRPPTKPTSNSASDKDEL